MAWTYANYNLVNYGICAGICAVSLVVVLAIFFTSKKGKKFVHDRIVGVSEDDLEKEEEDGNGEGKSTKKDEREKEKDNRTCSCCPKTKGEICLGILFCLIGSFALALAGVLIFQTCILANNRVLFDEVCPEYPMDCFIISSDTNGHNAISDTVSFQCQPLNKTQFPSHLTNATAQCFGWVASLQTTKNVLDQLGVCTGLLGLFSTLLAIIICLGGTCVELTLSILFLLGCIVGIFLVAYLKVSFSPLTYSVLSLGVAIGSFGVIFFIIMCIRKNRRGKTFPDEAKPMNRAASTNVQRPVVKTVNPQTVWQ